MSLAPARSAVAAEARTPAAAAEPAKPSSGDPLATPSPKKKRLVFDRRFHRFRWWEYATTAATGASAVGVFLFVSPSSEPKWIGPILFDEPVRDAFRLRSRSALKVDDQVSTIIAYVAPTQAIVDSILLPAVSGDLDVMWQLAMMDAQAFALSGLVTASLYDSVGRARPSYEDCKAGTSVDPLCGVGEYASFPSGHTAVAMTGAGLLCAHHEEMPLYGSHTADVAACVEGLTFATATAVLRVMGDRHYASDVMVGGAIGFFSGYALPKLLHYWKRPIGEVVSRDDLKVAFVPGTTGAPLGMRVMGVF